MTFFKLNNDGCKLKKKLSVS